MDLAKPIKSRPIGTLVFDIITQPLLSSFINYMHPHKSLTILHSSIVGSKPLLQSCGRNSNVASAFRAVWAQPNSTSTLDLTPALAALNKSTYYECEIRSRYDEKLENYFSISTQHINSHIIKKLSFDFGSLTKNCVGRFNQHHITTRLTLIHLMCRTKQVGLSSAL